MRGRIATAFGILLFITLIYIFTPKSAYPTHIAGGYPYVKPSTPQIYTPIPNKPVSTSAPQQLIVKVQLDGEDLNWLVKLLPNWRNQVITIDKSFAALHTDARRADRGRTADAYLRWIITNYNNLGETMLFVPPSLEPEATDKEVRRTSNAQLIAQIQDLGVPHVQTAGFAPLYCPSKSDCEAQDTFSTPPARFRILEANVTGAWQALFNSTHVPERLASPTRSVFAVSKTQIQQRSVHEWTRYWAWLAETEMDDESAGLLLERLWHVFLGRESEWCPGKECGCEIFGRC